MKELDNFINEMENLYYSTYSYLNNYEFDSFREMVLSQYDAMITYMTDTYLPHIVHIYVQDWKEKLNSFKLFNVAEIKEKLI